MAWPRALNGKENIAHRTPIRINRLWVRRNRTEGEKDTFQSAIFFSIVGTSFVAPITRLLFSNHPDFMRCPKRYGSLTGHVLSDQVGNGGLSRADMEAQYTLYYLPVRCRPTGVLAQEFGTHRGYLARSGRSVSPVCCPESVDAVSGQGNDRKHFVHRFTTLVLSRWSCPQSPPARASLGLMLTISRLGGRSMAVRDVDTFAG